MQSINQFIELLKESLIDGQFVKLSLSNYNGKEEALKNCYIKRVIIKNEVKLSFTYRYKTRDIVKNYSIEEALHLLVSLLGNENFAQGNLFTLQNDVLLEFKTGNQISLKKKSPTHTVLPSTEHNKKKERLIIADKNTYLHALKITDERGGVYPHAQDKYKQINRYIELLRPLLINLPKKDRLKIADMGSGKGYLTFALYDFLVNTLLIESQVVGVEFRTDLVDLCNTIAKQSQFINLSFKAGAIIDYSLPPVDVLIALHACDTATDEAISKGIKSQASLIVVAPCCHKQIRREMEKSKIINELDFLLKYGVFLEREAEMLTDGLRALILEYFDYSTKIIEFISTAHTPKNVMIVAERKVKTPEQKQLLLKKIKSTKTYFGISQHHLEKLMDI